MRSKTAKTFALAVLLVCLAIGARELADLRDRTRAKRTAGDMRQLSVILRSENPPLLAPKDLQRLLAAKGYPDYSRDAWGRPIEVERIQRASAAPSYVLRSLGKDGRRGKCCQRWLKEDWDSDAVLQDDTWLQIW